MQNKSVLLSGPGVAFVATEGSDGHWTVSLPPVSSIRLLAPRNIWEAERLSSSAQAMGFAEIAGTAIVETLNRRLAIGTRILGRIAETRSAIRMASDDSIRACLVAELDPSIGESATKRRCMSVLEDLRARTEVETDLLRSLLGTAAEMRCEGASCEAVFRTDEALLICRNESPQMLVETLLGMIQLSLEVVPDEEEISERLSVSGGVDREAVIGWLAAELCGQAPSSVPA
jgi:hypothetical protein